MEHYDMEQVIEQLKRIATALEDANLLNEEWIKRNREWRQENVEKGERDFSLSQDWIEWQKQQKIEEAERLERQRREDIALLERQRLEESEKSLSYIRERDGQLIKAMLPRAFGGNNNG